MAAKKKTDQTTKADQDRQIRQFKEMVNARSLIQPELIELLQFQRKYRENLFPSLYIRVAALLASTGFALWRAAFLFEQEQGEHGKYLSNIQTFISKIISDNMITFSDDKNTWSLWHYIGVARSSLLEALHLLKRDPESYKMEILRSRFGDPPLLSATSAAQWNELFEAMQLIREVLTAQFETMKKMPKLK
jgi:hypothetical protein